MILPSDVETQTHQAWLGDAFGESNEGLLRAIAISNVCAVALLTNAPNSRHHPADNHEPLSPMHGAGSQR